MKLLTWNVAGRVKRLSNQVRAIAQCGADVAVLQEVTARTALPLREELAAIGLAHCADSFSLCPEKSALIKARRFGQLIASRWPLTPLPPHEFAVPWHERVLSANVSSPFGLIELHTTGLPPGCNHGWLKIEMFEGIFNRLARVHQGHRILCGDFNTPEDETTDGTVVTWGSNGDRWDRGERNVLVGLAAFDLADVFRGLNGYGPREFSWSIRRKEKRICRRFDHIFASQSLRAAECRYLHGCRETGLSDHSPMLARFNPSSTHRISAPSVS